MKRSKEIFNEVREQEMFSDYEQQQRQVLNQIFEAWGKIYGAERVIKSNENEKKSF